jgi:hypothetical protein
MINMGIYKKAVISLVIALAVFFSAIFIPFLPCKVFPAPLNAEPYWSYCSISPDTALEFQTSKVLYLGYLESLETTYISIIFFVFIVSFIISITLFKSKNH